MINVADLPVEASELDGGDEIALWDDRDDRVDLDSFDDVVLSSNWANITYPINSSLPFYANMYVTGTWINESTYTLTATPNLYGVITTTGYSAAG